MHLSPNIILFMKKIQNPSAKISQENAPRRDLVRKATPGEIPGVYSTLINLYLQSYCVI